MHWIGMEEEKRGFWKIPQKKINMPMLCSEFIKRPSLRQPSFNVYSSQQFYIYFLLPFCWFLLMFVGRTGIQAHTHTHTILDWLPLSCHQNLHLYFFDIFSLSRWGVAVRAVYRQCIDFSTSKSYAIQTRMSIFFAFRIEFICQSDDIDWIITHT